MRLIAILCWLFSFTLHANTLNSKLHGHTELNYEYSIANVSSPQDIPASAWQRVEGGQINLGLGTSPVWLKFAIVNNTATQQDLFLFNAFVHIDKLTLYHKERSKLFTQRELGDSVPIKTRYLKDADQIFKLSLAPNQKQEYYIKAQTAGVMKLNLSLWQQDKYIEQKARFNLIMGLILGVMFASSLILSVLFFITKKQTFALAAVFNICVWLLFAWLLGYVYRYISDQGFWLVHTVMPALTIFVLIPLNILTERLLGLHSLAKPLVACLRITLGISVALVLISPLLSYTLALTVAVVFALFHILILLLVTGIRAQKRDTKAQLLVVCILPLLITMLYKGALIFSYSIFFSQLMVLFGISYLISCITLTLIAISQYIQQRDIKVSETIRLQEQHQEELESKIQERTFELEVTLRELQEKNLELEELNTLDSLTGLRNRRHFDKKITMEFRRSRREQTPLAVVMLDIDHFKPINDEYGHLAGDEAIKYVAASIKGALRRPSDIACRYGGEEFALILPNTDAEGAKLVSETIRKSIAKHAIKTSSGDVKLTISAGIFSHIADASLDPNQYTDWADKALYLAKQQGRNRVCFANSTQSPNDTEEL
ncbi:sensor domain-containing diguanylate cyclase [Pseudoalteromonas sp. G4]|uniref:sensor domain-containing diguanylate cyclase n=1 Tax=Pseudoalteromonas sp. G4 TaxID=2992761 RepID=UPI00237EB24C|nr:diguanylate cyclase [Pseudoalteromonas sp. G4]MDE3274134.1 diguanylate cyclase [Pseudoalteromonas sp. G4]